MIDEHNLVPVSGSGGDAYKSSQAAELSLNAVILRWRQLWSELAAFYDLPIAEPLAMSTVSEMSEKAPLWDAIVTRYGLHATPYGQIANWAFVDWMLNFREETILSTIKIRQAGFADCIDTYQSFRRQLTRLRDLRIVP